MSPVSDRPSDRVAEPGASHQVNGSNGVDKGADSYTPQRSSLRARRVGRRALHFVRDGLAERDLAVL